MGDNGLPEPGGKRPSGRGRGNGGMGATGNPTLGQGDLRQVAARLGRQGLGLGDSLPGIGGVNLAGAGLDRPGGFRLGDQAQGRERHDMFAN